MAIQDRRAREFERRGQEILAAALALFKSDDWESVTVEQIAQQAEVGKGTIYKHFASKDEIYARLAIGFQQQIVARFGEVDATLPIVERFRAHFHLAWTAHLASHELHRVFLFCSRPELRSRLSPETLADMLAVEQQVMAPTLQLLQEGIAQGVFPRKPLPQLLFGAQAAFWGAIQIVWSGYLGDIDRASFLDELSNFVLAGLIYGDRRLDAGAMPAAAPAAAQPAVSPRR